MREARAEVPPAGSFSGRCLLWLLVSLVLLLVAGQLSNMVSTASCEREVLRWFARSLPADKALVFPEPAVVGWEGELPNLLDVRLQQAGVKYRVLPLETFKQDPFPTCRLGPAIPVSPFIMTVDFAEATAILAGSGGRVYVLSFFGLSAVIWYSHEWVM